ncbi:hypothetical protein TRSC58_02049 [Trypanosoma rangeli SC58]|uniref:AAA+ ATPase domain-containing protein n=1 Tax=Trypanosoma rangeli SC58 TaxID=429131 RepID=A0A061J7Z3_TRYRA|nr:hypothetical protein TRSC58_02049 [Trypanosoma rangeli SC58]
MGGGLSRQEELFVLGKWSELLESAMDADTERSTEDADRGGRPSSQFRMSFHAWQALISLLDGAQSSEVPSRLCASIRGMHLLNPSVAVMIHACCWVDGSVSEKSFVERLKLLQDSLRSQESTPRRGRQSREVENERELVDTALRVLADLVAYRGEPLAQKRGSRVRNTAVEGLIAWGGSKRPVAVLAHAFIVGAVACIHPEPYYAEAAIYAFRKLQDVMNEAASAAARGRRGGKTAACNVAEWQAVRRLETVLVRRQQEIDVADLLATKDRWWLPSKTTTAHASSTKSQEERWEEVPLHYIGQQHIWATLKTHFLTSDIFNAEKPTVILLFGPSGFGKSELARRLACVIYGIEPGDVETSGKLIYIHLPSFCTRDSIYSLVDPPAAHVGEGVLLSALRRNDDAVVVLDEFEKGTANAIQNLWLSAFQKKGTLRSLKEASRSVSTEKVIFVLTCNTAADTILRREEEYLQATEGEQAKMRREWIDVCRDVCRRTMHDPFVNRVDYFFPFVPYTEAEKQQFIHLQLRRILLEQRARHHRFYVTPRMVKALAKKLQTFHASTIEGVVCPLLVEAIHKKWDIAVLTVVEHTSGSVFVALPATDTSDGVAMWNSLPGAKCALEMCEEPVGMTGSDGLVEKSLANVVPGGKSGGGVMSTNIVSRHKSVDAAPQLTSETVSASLDTSVGTEKKYTLQLETTVEKELQVELKRTKELLVLKEKEIAYLKEKVFQLEKILAFFLATTLMCLLLLSFLVGMKTVLVISLLLFVALWLLVKMPLQLLMGAIRVLYGVLGPVGSTLTVLVASLWASQALRNAAVC